MSISLQRKLRDRRGVAVLLAILLLAVLSISSAALWKHMHFTMAAGKRIENSAVSRDLAEAGLEKAIASLRNDPLGYRGETETPLGKGRFSVQVTPAGNGMEYHLISHGELVYDGVTRAERTLEAVLIFNPDGSVRYYHQNPRKKDT